jgi:hypothetical protein
VKIDAEFSVRPDDRRRGAPSPSASEINQRILDLLHEKGALSAAAIAEATREEIERVKGRVNALTRLGLLHSKEHSNGLTIYSLSSTGARAHELAYLSIHQT